MKQRKNPSDAKNPTKAAARQAAQPGIDPGPMLDQALALHRRGDTHAARSLYEQILGADPTHFDALHLLGVLEFQSNQSDLAIGLLKQALKVKPSASAPHVNLALAYRSQGEFSLARRSLERALVLDPGNVEALNNLGNLLRDLDQSEAALQHYDRALELKPDYASALNNRGNVLRDLGRAADALASFEAALALDANYAEAYFNRGNVWQDLRRHDDALRDFQQALRIKPELVSAWVNLGNVLQQQGQYAASLASYNEALQRQPNSAEARLNQAHALRKLHEPEVALLSYDLALRLHPDYVEALLGRADVLRDLDRYQEALANVDSALRLKPGEAAGFNTRGVILGMLGRFDEARADYRRAIALAPGKGMYYRNLVQAGTLEHDDPLLSAMQLLLQHGDALAAEDRVALHFALGEAWEKLGRHDASFAQYRHGNQLQRARVAYAEDATLALFDWYRTTFTPAFLQAHRGSGVGPNAGADAEADANSDAPIFVIGMPRSGSTLIEQILASHPVIFGAGERRDFVKATAAFVAAHHDGRGEQQTLAGMSATDLRELGQDYLRRIATVSAYQPAQHHRFVDKAPLNFIHVGLIHLALPNARFIHSRRAPIETCLSCYSKLFEEVPFSYDLGELGRYYRAYDALMAHWRAVLPTGVMLEVDYETLVDDFDAQARRMVAHCGLEWDPACAAFHRNPRAVATSSAEQVRQPLYRHALKRWQPAPELLQPLLDGLGTVLSQHG